LPRGIFEQAHQAGSKLLHIDGLEQVNRNSFLIAKLPEIRDIAGDHRHTIGAR
jgi:hypothetical protein